MGSTRLTDNLQILLNGSPFNKMRDVVDARVESSIGMTSVFNLRMRYDFEAWPFKIGDPIVVKIGTTQVGTMPVFSGEVVSLGVDIVDMGRELTVTAYDKSYKLARATKNKAYTQQSYQDVISAMVGAAGLQSTLDASLGEVVYDYILQTTTDFAFLNEICLRTGCEWSVTDTTLTVRPRTPSDSGVTLKPAESLMRLRARYSSYEDASDVKAMGWDVTQKAAATASGASAVKATPDGGPALFTGSGADGVSSAVLTSAGLLATTTDEANALAKGLASRINASQMIVKGECLIDPRIVVGKTVTIQGAGAQLNGKYYVTQVEHVYGMERSITTRFTAGGIEPSGIVDLLGAADTGVRSWPQLGVVVGIVTANDQQSDSQSVGPGYVKVKFPALDEQIESAKARLVVPEAGDGRGTYFVPSINDEVLVAFEHGDLRRPYVLGSLWNGKDKPPVIQDQIGSNGVTAVRQIKTPAGHTLTFTDNDAPDKASVIILLKDNKTTLKMTLKGIELISDAQDIKIDNGQCSILLAKNGDVTIKGQKITLDAQQDLTIKGLNINSKAQANYKVEANASAEMKANAGLKLETSAIAQIKGSLVQIN